MENGRKSEGSVPPAALSTLRLKFTSYHGTEMTSEKERMQAKGMWLDLEWIMLSHMVIWVLSISFR